MFTIVNLSEGDTNGEATPQEIEAFVNAKGGMTLGWTGSFDKLEDYLQRYNAKH